MRGERPSSSRTINNGRTRSALVSRRRGCSWWSTAPSWISGSHCSGSGRPPCSGPSLQRSTAQQFDVILVGRPARACAALRVNRAGAAGSDARALPPRGAQASSPRADSCSCTTASDRWNSAARPGVPRCAASLRASAGSSPAPGDTSSSESSRAPGRARQYGGPRRPGGDQTDAPGVFTKEENGGCLSEGGGGDCETPVGFPGAASVGGSRKVFVRRSRQSSRSLALASR